MSIRRATPATAVHSAAKGSGVFKNLFETKCDFPLKDEGTPPPRSFEPIGSNGAIGIGDYPLSFEVVGTLQPVASLSTVDQMLLNGFDDPTSSDDDDEMLGEEVRELVRGARSGPSKTTENETAVALIIRVRKIEDDETRARTAAVIQKRILSSVQSVLTTNEKKVWETGVKFTMKTEISTCSPLLSEHVMIWLSTTQVAHDLLVGLVIGREIEPEYLDETFMDAFFRVIFGGLDEEVDLSDSSQPSSSSDNSGVMYTRKQSTLTQWRTVHDFEVPVQGGNGVTHREGRYKQPVFSASEFFLDPSLVADDSAMRNVVQRL